MTLSKVLAEAELLIARAQVLALANPYQIRSGPDGGRFTTKEMGSASGVTTASLRKAIKAADDASYADDDALDYDGKMAALHAQVSELLVMDLPNGYRSVLKEDAPVNFDGDGIFVSGTILDAKGNDAALWERELHPAEGRVVHTYMRSYSEYAGQGIGSEFVKQSEAKYKAAGFTSVELDAGLEAGGYAWAKAGYNWRGPVPKEFIGELRQRVGKVQKHLSDDESLKLARAVDSLSTTGPGRVIPYWFAKFKSADGEVTGRTLLAGTKWYGVKNL